MNQRAQTSSLVHLQSNHHIQMENASCLIQIWPALRPWEDYGQVSAWGIWPELALVGSNVSPQWPSRRDGGGQQPQPPPPPPPPGVRLLFQFVKSLESLRMNLKEINSFINKNDKSCGFFTDATYQQEEVPVYSVWIFSFVYFYEKILDFIKYFYWNDQVISFFH